MGPLEMAEIFMGFTGGEKNSPRKFVEFWALTDPSFLLQTRGAKAPN